jgi:methylenetetrahydrofolate reductase (NADPH)
MNHGQYLDEDLLDADPTDFCIGVGGYPEKHFEAPNLAPTSTSPGRRSTPAPSTSSPRCSSTTPTTSATSTSAAPQASTVPIIPGLKILTSRAQVTSLPRTFFISLPDSLTEEALAADPKHVMDIGVEWAVRQTEDLLAKGVPSVHFYIMQSSEAITKVLGRVKL